MVESKMGQPMGVSAPPAGHIVIGTTIINPYTGAAEPSTYTGPRSIVAGPESMERSSELLALNIAQGQQKRAATKAYEEAKTEIQALQKEAAGRQASIKQMSELQPGQAAWWSTPTELGGPSETQKAEMETQWKLYKMVLPEFKGTEGIKIESLKKLEDIASGLAIVRTRDIALPGVFQQRVLTGEKGVREEKISAAVQKGYEEAVTKAATEEMGRIRREYFGPVYEAEGRGARAAAMAAYDAREVARDAALRQYQTGVDPNTGNPRPGAMTWDEYRAWEKENYLQKPTTAAEAQKAADAALKMWAMDFQRTAYLDAAAVAKDRGQPIPKISDYAVPETDMGGKRGELYSQYGVYGKAAFETMSPSEQKAFLPKDVDTKWFLANAAASTQTGYMQKTVDLLRQDLQEKTDPNTGKVILENQNPKYDEKLATQVFSQIGERATAIPLDYSGVISPTIQVAAPTTTLGAVSPITKGVITGISSQGVVTTDKGSYYVKTGEGFAPAKAEQNKLIKEYNTNYAPLTGVKVKNWDEYVRVTSAEQKAFQAIVPETPATDVTAVPPGFAEMVARAQGGLGEIGVEVTTPIAKTRPLHEVIGAGTVSGAGKEKVGIGTPTAFSVDALFRRPAEAPTEMKEKRLAEVKGTPWEGLANYLYGYQPPLKEMAQKEPARAAVIGTLAAGALPLTFTLPGGLITTTALGTAVTGSLEKGPVPTPKTEVAQGGLGELGVPVTGDISKIKPTFKTPASTPAPPTFPEKIEAKPDYPAPRDLSRYTTSGRDMSSQLNAIPSSIKTDNDRTVWNTFVDSAGTYISKGEKIPDSIISNIRATGNESPVRQTVLEYSSTYNSAIDANSRIMDLVNTKGTKLTPDEYALIGQDLRTVADLSPSAAVSLASDVRNASVKQAIQYVTDDISTYGPQVTGTAVTSKYWKDRGTTLENLAGLLPAGDSTRSLLLGDKNKNVDPYVLQLNRFYSISNIVSSSAGAPVTERNYLANSPDSIARLRQVDSLTGSLTKIDSVEIDNLKTEMVLSLGAREITGRMKYEIAPLLDRGETEVAKQRLLGLADSSPAKDKIFTVTDESGKTRSISVGDFLRESAGKLGSESEYRRWYEKERTAIDPTTGETIKFKLEAPSIKSTDKEWQQYNDQKFEFYRETGKAIGNAGTGEWKSRSDILWDNMLKEARAEPRSLKGLVSYIGTFQVIQQPMEAGMGWVAGLGGERGPGRGLSEFAANVVPFWVGEKGLATAVGAGGAGTIMGMAAPLLMAPYLGRYIMTPVTETMLGGDAGSTIFKMGAKDISKVTGEFKAGFEADPWAATGQLAGMVLPIAWDIGRPVGRRIADTPLAREARLKVITTPSIQTVRDAMADLGAAPEHKGLLGKSIEGRKEFAKMPGASDADTVLGIERVGYPTAFKNAIIKTARETGSILSGEFTKLQTTAITDTPKEFSEKMSLRGAPKEVAAAAEDISNIQRGSEVNVHTLNPAAEARVLIKNLEGEGFKVTTVHPDNAEAFRALEPVEKRTMAPPKMGEIILAPTETITGKAGIEGLPLSQKIGGSPSSVESSLEVIKKSAPDVERALRDLPEVKAMLEGKGVLSLKEESLESLINRLNPETKAKLGIAKGPATMLVEQVERESYVLPPDPKAGREYWTFRVPVSETGYKELHIFQARKLPRGGMDIGLGLLSREAEQTMDVALKEGGSVKVQTIADRLSRTIPEQVYVVVKESPRIMREYEGALGIKGKVLDAADVVKERLRSIGGTPQERAASLRDLMRQLEGPGVKDVTIPLDVRLRSITDDISSRVKGVGVKERLLKYYSEREGQLLNEASELRGKRDVTGAVRAERIYQDVVNERMRISKTPESELRGSTGILTTLYKYEKELSNVPALKTRAKYTDDVLFKLYTDSAKRDVGEIILGKGKVAEYVKTVGEGGDERLLLMEGAAKGDVFKLENTKKVISSAGETQLDGLKLELGFPADYTRQQMLGVIDKQIGDAAAYADKLGRMRESSKFDPIRVEAAKRVFQRYSDSMAEIREYEDSLASTHNKGRDLAGDRAEIISAKNRAKGEVPVGKEGRGRADVDDRLRRVVRKYDPTFKEYYLYISYGDLIDIEKKIDSGIAKNKKETTDLSKKYSDSAFLKEQLELRASDYNYWMSVFKNPNKPVIIPFWDRGELIKLEIHPDMGQTGKMFFKKVAEETEMPLSAEIGVSQTTGGEFLKSVGSGYGVVLPTLPGGIDFHNHPNLPAVDYFEYLAKSDPKYKGVYEQATRVLPRDVTMDELMRPSPSATDVAGGIVSGTGRSYVLTSEGFRIIDFGSRDLGKRRAAFQTLDSAMKTIDEPADRLRRMLGEKNKFTAKDVADVFSNYGAETEAVVSKALSETGGSVQQAMPYRFVEGERAYFIETAPPFTRDIMRTRDVARGPRVTEGGRTISKTLRLEELTGVMQAPEIARIVRGAEVIETSARRQPKTVEQWRASMRDVQKNIFGRYEPEAAPTTLPAVIEKAEALPVVAATSPVTISAELTTPRAEARPTTAPKAVSADVRNLILQYMRTPERAGEVVLRYEEVGKAKATPVEREPLITREALRNIERKAQAGRAVIEVEDISVTEGKYSRRPDTRSGFVVPVIHAGSTYYTTPAIARNFGVVRTDLGEAISIRALSSRITDDGKLLTATPRVWVPHELTSYSSGSYASIPVLTDIAGERRIRYTSRDVVEKSGVWSDEIGKRASKVGTSPVIVSADVSTGQISLLRGEPGTKVPERMGAKVPETEVPRTALPSRGEFIPSEVVARDIIARELIAIPDDTGIKARWLYGIIGSAILGGLGSEVSSGVGVSTDISPERIGKRGLGMETMPKEDIGRAREYVPISVTKPEEETKVTPIEITSPAVGTAVDTALETALAMRTDVALKLMTPTISTLMPEPMARPEPKPYIPFGLPVFRPRDMGPGGGGEEPGYMGARQIVHPIATPEQMLGGGVFDIKYRVGFPEGVKRKTVSGAISSNVGDIISGVSGRSRVIGATGAKRSVGLDTNIARSIEMVTGMQRAAKRAHTIKRPSYKRKQMKVKSPYSQVNKKAMDILGSKLLKPKRRKI